MKKSGVIWRDSQKQYNMLNEQYKELQKKHISHSLENWDYTLLHTSNLTKNKSAKQSRKINRK